jgi:DNA-binding transcriptional ArsR family regulator
MEILQLSEILSALGHEARLSIFRALVQAGTEGLTPSVISAQLSLPPATLSFHLSHLSRVGLISGKQQSRFIHYTANFELMDEALAFLTQNCCQGNACLPKLSAVNKGTKSR